MKSHALCFNFSALESNAFNNALTDWSDSVTCMPTGDFAEQLQKGQQQHVEDVMLYMPTVPHTHSQTHAECRDTYTGKYAFAVIQHTHPCQALDIWSYQ